MNEPYEQNTTRISKAIFPNTLNANETLFGGLIMQWMDEAAYIAATRFTKQRMFTLTVSDINFLKAVEPNTIVEVIAKVVKSSTVKLTVQVDLNAEEMYGTENFKAAEAQFTMVALNENNKPQRLQLQTDKAVAFEN